MSVVYRELINRDLPLVDRACQSKAVYVSRREAQSFARTGRHANGSMSAYRCRFCEMWHLGHRRRHR